MKKIIALLSLLLSISLCGCFSVKEDLKIEADGSGQFTLSVTLCGELAADVQKKPEDERKKDREKMEKDLREWRDKHENISDASATVKSDGDTEIATLDVKFKDVTKLAADLTDFFDKGNGPKMGKEFGQFAVVKNDKGNYEISRIIGEKEEKKDKTPEQEKADKAMREEMAKEFKGQFYRVRVFGAAFGEHNGKADEKECFLEWSMDLEQATIKGDSILEIKAEILPKK